MRADDFISNAPPTVLLDEIIEKVKARRANTYQVGGSHYLSMDIQPWDIIDTWPLEQRIGFYKGNALKYLMRMGRKGPLEEDARKALHYAEKLDEVIHGGCDDPSS